jgi:hypothetical protein
MKDRDELLSLIPLIAALGLVGFVFWLTVAPPANAQSTGQRAHSFVVATSTSVARVETDIAGASKDYREIRCWNNSATPVYLGDLKNQEYPVCTDTALCSEAALSVASTALYARASSGTPNLTCITLR